MGYMIKSVVMQAIEKDMKDALHVYSDKQSKDIVKFCYESVAREIDKLPQYRIDTVYDIDNWIPCSERLPKEHDSNYISLGSNGGMKNEKLHVQKSCYNKYANVPVVEWDYATGSTNYARCGDGCAVRTKTVSVIGKIIEVNDNDMVIENNEIGTVQIKYRSITGIFPCSLSQE